MKLAEALSIVRSSPSDGHPLPVLLACGFTPLHLQNFLAAHLQKRVPQGRVTLSTGLYGDAAGTLEAFSADRFDACALALEWSDLDPRLGFRQLGGWGQRVWPGVLSGVEDVLERLVGSVSSISKKARVAVCLPTLPLPPGFHTTGWQASEIELRLQDLILRFAARLTSCSVSVLNSQQLDALSPRDARYDLRSDVHSGFPYSVHHADVVAAGLASLLQPSAPKKGLITDLDDTLWQGLVGEVGADKIAWELSEGGHLHGLYQQMLHALADHGVLIGVASKNAAENVERALSRSDLVVPRDKLFPLEIHWDSKSGSVERILKAWNIGADSVVFVDDSPMELEEVRAAHPGIECLLFPKADYAGALSLLQSLRDLFGKAALSEEDSFRLQSIRSAHNAAEMDPETFDPEQFLSAAQAHLTLEFSPAASDRRILELINKTNQFNLNGVRFSEAEWERLRTEPNAFVWAVSYDDKFGRLGKIAVLRGTANGSSVRVSSWVMSCRAFSRRIEDRCLGILFDRFKADEIHFDFTPTAKNGPMAEFLERYVQRDPASVVFIPRARFRSASPVCYHRTTEIQ